jgi:hypothetical protein
LLGKNEMQLPTLWYHQKKYTAHSNRRSPTRTTVAKTQQYEVERL